MSRIGAPVSKKFRPTTGSSKLRIARLSEYPSPKVDCPRFSLLTTKCPYSCAITEEYAELEHPPPVLKKLSESSDGLKKALQVWARLTLQTIGRSSAVKPGSLSFMKSCVRVACKKALT